MKKSIIQKAEDYVRRLFDGNSGGHDFMHALRVAETARKIAEDEGYGPETAENTVLAALLHDADDGKLFDTEDCENAMGFLLGEGMERGRAERICRAIGAVSFSKNGLKAPDTPEGRAVQDADRLDAMGAVGIARTFAYGGERGRSMADSVGHFHEKLLRLIGGMNTETALREAARRLAYMEGYLTELERETGGNV